MTAPTRTHWTRSPWLARLGALPVIACCAASVDSMLTRADYTYRPRDFELFLETATLWGVYALLAMLPATLFDALWRRRTRNERFARPLHVGLRLGGWTVLPVLVHAYLDRFTRVGGDVSGLWGATPWLGVTGIVAAVALSCWLAGRALQRIPTPLVALGLGVSAILMGRFLPLDPSRVEPSAPPPGAEHPNVLLVVWDTTRANNISLYGYDRQTTPHLAQFAADSLLFSNARSVSVYTLTSHISMLTGVYPSDHGARMVRQRFDPLRTPSVAETFRRAGYRTGAFVGTDVLRAHSGVGYGFETYDDQVDPWVTYTRSWALLHDLQSIAGMLVPAWRQNGLPHWVQDFQRPASDVLRDAREWIQRDDPRPWFCMVNLYDVHWPYLPEQFARDKWVSPYSGIVDGYSHRGDRVRQADYTLDDTDVRHLAELYDAELYELDRDFDAFLSELDLQRTAVVLTSDHGEALGEAGHFEHADLLDCQTRIPLIVRPHGSTQGRVIDAPVNGIDIAPTLLALGGLTDGAGMMGRNLLGELPADHPQLVEDRDHVQARRTKIALWSGPWKLVRIGMEPEQTWHLFDTATDPFELRDLASERPEIVAHMRSEMEALRARWGADDRHDAVGEGIDNADALRALGYIGDEARAGQ